MGKELYQFFSPQSVAIIGASQKKGAIGNTVVRNFIDLNFKGKVYPINPKYDQIEGFRCYPEVTAIPDEVDVAVIAVPNEHVETSIRTCAKKGIKYLLVFSSGFAELGEEGARKQEEIIKFCKEHNIRLLGPNTLGMMNVHDKISLTFQDVSATLLLPGEVGLVAQSGATGSQVLNIASEEQIGFTYMVATGNQPDLNTVEVMDFYVDDERTKLIGFYMEGVPDGKDLLSMAKKALEKHKPVIGIKSGRSNAGQRAAMSHTGSMTGSNEVFQVSAEKYGMTMVEGLDQLVDALKVFRSDKRPKGNRVGTVVVSGATGIMLADALHDYGLEMVELKPKTQNKLKEVLPSYCSVVNPVDIASTFVMKPVIYPHSIQTLVDADEVDMIMVHLPVPQSLGPMKYAKEIVEIAKNTDKPIIVMPTGTEEDMAEVRYFLNKHKVPAYRNLEMAAKAAYDLLKYERIYEKHKSIKASSKVKPTTLNAHQGASSVTEYEVKKLLTQHNIPVPKSVLIKSDADLKKVDKELQYPLVAKIVSPDITHKSDIGGVALNITNEQQLKNAYYSILTNIHSKQATAQIDGILVEEMMEGPSIEAIVGVSNDPQFGPVILCGLGGIYVEIMKDVTRRLAPVSEEDALEMIKELKSYPIFTGARKGISFDVKAFSKALAQISNLALSLGDSWADLEINPLIIRAEGKGVVALDGLITLNNQKQLESIK